MISRRAVLGLGAAGAGLLAAASTSPARAAQLPAVGAVPRDATPTPTESTLRYILACGHDFAPLANDPASASTKYRTDDGRFEFVDGSWGYASVLPNLPVGAVLKEVELYGERGAQGDVVLELWRSTVSTGAVERTASKAAPFAAGDFTVTVKVDEVHDITRKTTPFVYISTNAAPMTRIWGMRIGYAGPSTYFPVEPFRAYDSRVASYSPSDLMTPNSNRVVSVKDAHDAAGAVTVADAVPTGATAVSINVTVAGPTGPNYLAVVPGDAPGFTASTINWPGGFDTANGATVKLDADRQLKLFCGDQGGSTHVIVDVTGYYA